MRRLNADKRPLLTIGGILLLAALLPAIVFAIGRDRGDRGPTWEPVERAPVVEARERPNIVFVLTDDQEYTTFNDRYMPRAMRLFADGGTVFRNFVVATPVCCPSRASTITGSYPHNSGVWMNKDGWSRLRDKQNNLGGWLQHAGYRTAWIGKFLQGYKEAVPDPAEPAPGWDDWVVSLKPKYFGYKLYENGQKVRAGYRPRDYYTDVLTDTAIGVIRQQSERPRPFFILLNHLAPHRGGGGTGRCAGTVAPAPRDFGKFAHEPLPKPPSFNEEDRSDKSAFPSGGPLDTDQTRKEAFRYRCRVESLAAVDRGLGRIERELERTGELDNTVIVLSSDNGILQGQHALTGKSIPYEEGLKVPFAIRVPERILGRSSPDSTQRLAANIDLAPTLLELARAQPCVSKGDCRTLDGRSLLPLIAGRERQWPRDRAIAIEGGEHGNICDYRGLRLERSVLLQRVEAAGDGCRPKGEPELYDLDRDPYQLDNLALTRAEASHATVVELQRRLDALSSCSGSEAREQRGGRASFCD